MKGKSTAKTARNLPGLRRRSRFGHRVPPASAPLPTLGPIHLAARPPLSCQVRHPPSAVRLATAFLTFSRVDLVWRSHSSPERPAPSPSMTSAQTSAVTVISWPRPPASIACPQRGSVLNGPTRKSPLCNPSRASLLTGLRPDQIRFLIRHAVFARKNPKRSPCPAFPPGGLLCRPYRECVFHRTAPRGPGRFRLLGPHLNPKGRDRAEEHLVTTSAHRNPPP